METDGIDHINDTDNSINSMSYNNITAKNVDMGNSAFFSGNKNTCILSCYLLTDQITCLLNNLGRDLAKYDYQLVILSHVINPKLLLPYIKVPYSFSDYYDEIVLPNGYAREKEFAQENEWIERDAAFSDGKPYDSSQLKAGLIKAQYFFETLINQFNPSIVFLWGNTLPQCSLQKNISEWKKIPAFIIERGLFSNTMMVEKEGHGADSELNKINDFYVNLESFIPSEYERIKSYYLNKQLEKYPQAEYKSVKVFKDQNEIKDKKVIVFWGQHDVWSGLVPRPYDLSFRNSPWFESTKECFAELSEVVSKRKDSILFFKPHPHDTYEYNTNLPNVKIVKNENNRTLMQMADVFVAMTSTIQFEALLYEKPLVLLANSQLSGKNIAFEFDKSKSLPDVLHDALSRKDFSLKNDCAKKYINYLFEKYLIGYADAPTKKSMKDFSKFIAENGTAPIPGVDKIMLRENENRILKPCDEQKPGNEIKIISFYLPQYHPIPENNNAWGKGFTEWTNVAKAQPLFPGHYQPQLPGELGFYDLRLDEVRKEQIDLAKEYGIHGFCYYYYWFNGKEVLETPIKKLLANKELDFPFCVCWANENWTRKWDGHTDDIIFGQLHNEKDDIDFIKGLVPYFSDERYIKVDGKPMLLIYRTELFPDIRQTAQTWREELRNAGLGELYLVRVESFAKGIIPEEIGFDAAVEFAPDWKAIGNPKDLTGLFPDDLKNLCVHDYPTMMQNMLSRKQEVYKLFRGVTPAWDNTARRRNEATVFVNSSPELYEEWLKKTILNTQSNLNENEKFIFINAWNEWGEGNHLEPDIKFGRKYLEATLSAMKEAESIINGKERNESLHHDQANNDELIADLNSKIDKALKEKNLFDANTLIKKVSVLDTKNVYTINNIIHLNNKKKEVQADLGWSSQQTSKYLLKAEKLIENSEPSEAEKLLILILGFEPEHIEALIDLSVVYIITERYDLAKEILEDVIKLDPENDVALGNMVYLLNLTNNFNKEIINELETCGTESIKTN